ncbi:hypothetical protein SDJN02_12526, partial [Cucurbita argyrosperma subsp. argyrosperma]
MEGKSSNKVIHKRVNTLDKFSRKMFTLIEPCCCILCRRVEEDLDHILCTCSFAGTVCSLFFKGDMNNRTFKGIERDPSDFWSLVRFY